MRWGIRRWSVAGKKCRDIWSQSIPTLCQSVKSGTAVDCFTLHQCRYTVVTQHRGAAICKHYTSQPKPTGIQLFKKGLAVEDINHQRRPGSCKRAGGKPVIWLSVQIGFYSLVKKKKHKKNTKKQHNKEKKSQSICSQGYLDKKLTNRSTFSSFLLAEIHLSSRAIFTTQMTLLPLLPEQKEALSNLTLSSARSIW